MVMDIDQTGNDVGALKIDGIRLRRGQNIDKFAVFDGKGAGDKTEILGVQHCIFEIHGGSSVI